jgi:predicted RNA-binding Zn-ribbon protein involved in translation (DUF1610 family)
MMQLPGGGRNRMAGGAGRQRYISAAMQNNAPQATYTDRSGRQQPLYATDFSGKMLPIHLSIGELYCPRCNAQIGGGVGGGQTVSCPSCRTPVVDNRQVLYYCPSCNDAVLTDRGPMGGNGMRSFTCSYCSVKWRTSEDMPRGIGLEMR